MRMVAYVHVVFRNSQWNGSNNCLRHIVFGMLSYRETVLLSITKQHLFFLLLLNH